jgi:site-specific recombinase XerD
MDYRRDYLADARLRGVRSSTLERFLYACAALERSTGVQTQLTTRAGLRTWLGEQTTNGAAFNLRTIRPFFRWMVVEELREDDPTVGIKIKVQHEAQVTADDSQIKRLVAASRVSVRDHAIISVLVATGCRRSELGMASFGDARKFIDSGMLMLANSKTVKRVVPLDPTAERALRKWLRTNDKAPDLQNLWKVKLGPQLIAKTVKTYDPSLTTHSLRRWFVSRWLKKGGSLVSLGRMCGWSPSTTATMAHIYSAGVGQEVLLAEYARVGGF